MAYILNYLPRASLKLFNLQDEGEDNFAEYSINHSVPSSVYNQNKLYSPTFFDSEEHFKLAKSGDNSVGLVNLENIESPHDAHSCNQQDEHHSLRKLITNFGSDGQIFHNDIFEVFETDTGNSKKVHSEDNNKLKKENMKVKLENEEELYVNTNKSLELLNINHTFSNSLVNINSVGKDKNLENTWLRKDSGHNSSDFCGTFSKSEVVNPNSFGDFSSSLAIRNKRFSSQKTENKSSITFLSKSPNSYQEMWRDSNSVTDEYPLHYDVTKLIEEGHEIEIFSQNLVITSDLLKETDKIKQTVVIKSEIRNDPKVLYTEDHSRSPEVQQIINRDSLQTEFKSHDKRFESKTNSEKQFTNLANSICDIKMTGCGDHATKNELPDIKHMFNKDCIKPRIKHPFNVPETFVNTTLNELEVELRIFSEPYETETISSSSKCVIHRESSVLNQQVLNLKDNETVPKSIDSHNKIDSDCDSTRDIKLIALNDTFHNVQPTNKVSGAHTEPIGKQSFRKRFCHRTIRGNPSKRKLEKATFDIASVTNVKKRNIERSSSVNAPKIKYVSTYYFSNNRNNSDVELAKVKATTTPEVNSKDMYGSYNLRSKTSLPTPLQRRYLPWEKSALSTYSHPTSSQQGIVNSSFRIEDVQKQAYDSSFHVNTKYALNFRNRCFLFIDSDRKHREIASRIPPPYPGNLRNLKITQKQIVDLSSLTSNFRVQHKRAN